MKKTLALLLAVLLVLTSVSALAEGLTYPLDTDVTLTIWMPISSSCTNKISSYAENESFIYAQEATGIKIKFIHPSEATKVEEFNLMVASDELPDIIVNPTYLGTSANATACASGVEDGLFLDLTDLMAEYSPTYYSYLMNSEEFYQDATTSDGRILYYTNYKPVTADQEGSWDRFQVRADWLAEIGLDTLRTVADYEKYFQHILDTKPGVTPFTLVKTGIERCFTTAFGISGDGFYHVGDEIHYGAYEDSFKDYLELMHSWYEKGYISPDFTSVSKEREEYLAGLSGGCCDTSVDTFELAATLDLPIQNCPYMRVTEDQQIYGFYYLRPANGQYTVITKDCKHVKEAMAFIDYGYTVEGSYTYCYGVPNVAWVYGEDGLPKYTDYILNNDKGLNMTELSYILRFHEGFPHMRDSDAFSIPSNSQNPACLAYRLQWQDDPLCDGTGHCLPSITLSTEDSLRRSEIMAECDTYIKEMVLKFITGAESLDKFDEYKATLKSMNIEEALELTSKGYQTLQSKTIPTK